MKNKTIIKVSIGDALDTEHNFYLQYENGILCYGRGGICWEKLPDPTKKQWRKFWKKINKLEVWDWDEIYSDPDLPDSTQWNIDIHYENKTIKSSGSNKYPENYHKFIKGIKKLIGNLDLF